MDTSILLPMLKTDLGFTADAYDSRLIQYLQTAEASIRSEGAELDPSDLNDMNLVVMYAAWQWRKRDSGEGMPRMLRYALNCRILGQKAGE